MASKAGGALSGAASGAMTGAKFGPWGAAIGGVLGGLSGLFGQQDAPNIPNPPTLNAQSAFTDAAGFNQRNLGTATKVTSDINTAAQNEANRLMELAVPGYSKMQSKLMEAAASDLASENKLPAEMEAEIARMAAERGISRGTSGQFNDFSLIKDFGFNMVDYAQAQRVKALNTLSSIMGMTPRVNPMSPMSMLIDTNTALQVQQTNQDRQWQTDLVRAGYQAKADNYNAALVSGNLMGALEVAMDDKKKKPAATGVRQFSPI